MVKRIFVIIPTLIFLLGISDVAFAKHHHHHKNEDNKDDSGRKVPCLLYDHFPQSTVNFAQAIFHGHLS